MTASAARRWDGPLWFPAVLAAAIGVELTFDDWTIPAARALPAVAAIAAFLWRKQRPLVATVSAFAAQAAFEIPAGLNDHELAVTFGHVLAGIVLIYSLCRWAEPTTVAVGLVICSALVWIGELADGGSEALNAEFIVSWLIVGLAALAMRYRAGLTEAQHERVRLEERNSLARDLHDTVAHYVSAIAVQAQAAAYVVDSDTTTAKNALGDIERTAKTALDEMRQMVGILRSDSDDSRSVMPSSLADLARPGDDPKVIVNGDVDLTELPATNTSAAYRIAQEAITNASRHSDGVTFIEVTVTRERDSLELEVINDGQPSTRRQGSGYGMIGMVERAEALGGSVDAGPRPASGWKVHASIPTRRPE